MRLALAGVPLIVVALWSGSARSQDQALLDKIAQMNRAAFVDVDNREWDGARRKLLDALDEENKSGLARHPLMARTYVTLGVVYVMGFRDRAKAVKYFRRGLAIQDDIRLVRSMATTADVDDAFAEAGGRPWPRPAVQADGSVEPDLPAIVRALDCSVAEETRVDQAVPVRCAVAPNLPATKVFLFYREPSEPRFAEVELKRTPTGWFQGRIPERVIYGKSVQYYFEGRNAARKTIVRNGDAQSPSLVLVVKR